MVTTSAVIKVDWQIEPVGDRCLLIRLGQHLDAQVSQTVQAVAALLMARPIPGVIDVVPVFTTVALHYLPTGFARGRESAFAQLSRQVEDLLARGIPRLAQSGRVVEIPACYGGEFGPDLEDVATRCSLTPQEVVELHCAVPQLLYTFFFSPGNPYAGPLDPRLQVPRRSTPRTLVPAGSVSIANGISSIYQMATPGGWNLIARTPWNLFDLRNDPPTRLQLGDQLRFVSISPADFAAMDERA
jgi:inhibitor of KinA